MKQILIFLSIFLSSLSITTTGQCIDNAGHIMGDIDSIHTHDCEWFIDTVDVKVGRVKYVGEEYVVYPESCDTLFYQCVRCDSNIVMPSQSIKRYVRDVASVLNPEPEASYKVYTALLSQSGTSAPTATVLENTLGSTPTYSYYDVGRYYTNCTDCFTTNKTLVTFSKEISNIGDEGISAYLRFQIVDDDQIYITTATADAGFGDGYIGGVGYFDNVSIEIRVYP